jgi:hypothetical protein
VKVLHYVAKATGGRGKKGGLDAYAKATGMHAGNLTTYRAGAEVAETLLLIEGFSAADIMKKALHLAAIHKLPQDAWPQAGAARRAG